jgi:hypothetical protein
MPKIDERRYEGIVEQTEALIRDFTSVVRPTVQALDGRILDEDVRDAGTGELIASRETIVDTALARRISQIGGLKRVEVVGWRPRAEGKADAGAALVRIFARMAELVIDRLNQVPDKGLLAFLDLIGTQVSPPRPARVPLTFQLAAGSPVSALVPAGTRVAAPALEKEEEEVIFETEQDLLLTNARLASVFVHEPGADHYDDYTRQATGPDPQTFPAFEGDKDIEHSLYLACEGIFTARDPKTVTLNIYTPDAAQLENLRITWSYWDGAIWAHLAAASSLAKSERWEVTIENMPALAPSTIEGQQAGWLRAKLGPDYEWGVPPLIKRITADVEANDLMPDLAFCNSLPLDMSKDFYPFGERPRFNDTFYIASQEAFSRPGATITLGVTLSDLAVTPIANDPEVKWEVCKGESWEELDVKEEPAGVATFTKKGSIELTFPETIAPGTVNGETNYWIRARLVGGNYSTKEGGFGPPSVASLSYRQSGSSLSACLAYNDFSYADYTDEAADEESSFPAFSPSHEKSPALYVGFDRPFANRAVALYAGVEPPVYQAEASNSGRTPARVGWEYYGPGGWTRLMAQDETQGFAQPGLITFIGPNDFAVSRRFGAERYWLRALREEGDFPTSPRLFRLLTNTTWASQATTVQNETLGSSNGEPNQIFRAARRPVLLGPEIEVCEPELPSEHERAQIQSEEGEDAIHVILDRSGRPKEVWVRWHQVPDFYASGSRDRHYVLDHLAGEVRFGDGRQGMVPPQARNNVRIARYRTGGGTAGNRPAGRVIQLKSAVPYVTGVTNHAAAYGGTDQETLEDVKERGPRALRHRGRAVTAADFEDLAYLASPDVARALAVPPHYDPFNAEWPPPYDAGEAGWVGLILVPRSTDPRPVPSLDLIQRVREYILARCVPTLDLWLAGPDWVRVDVSVDVAPISLGATGGLEARVIGALERFLHPLTGGLDAQGWAFGRRPHKSDLYALIEAIDGVDHIRSLSVVEIEDETVNETVRPDRFMVYSGKHTISLVLPEEGA